AARDDDDVGPRDIRETGVRPEGKSAGLVGDNTSPFRGENDLSTGEVMQHLVRANRVKRGKAVKQRDDDLHGAAPWSESGVGGTALQSYGPQLVAAMTKTPPIQPSSRCSAGTARRSDWMAGLVG